nr:immunoglobulin heavy chain junction region [Macaca mulatta]MOV46212.1 immunoglobulin heavy chain junction region [Macaca mulatta]
CARRYSATSYYFDSW